MQSNEYLHREKACFSREDLPDPGEVLLRYLRRHGLRQTSRRELILEVFWDMDGHPSPEEIRDEVLRRDQTVGLATIYRTLKLFLKSGIARKQRFSDGLDRYEPSYGKKQHLHLICELCGRNMEVPASAMDTMYEELATTRGFTLRSHQTCLYGVCDACIQALTVGDAMQSRDWSTKGEIRP